MPRLDFYTHGLWIMGTVFFLLGAVLAGNLRWVEGTTEAFFALAILLSFGLFAVAGLMWISAGTNVALERAEEQPREVREVKEEVKEIREALREEERATNGAARPVPKDDGKIRRMEKDIEEIKEVMKEEER